MRQPAKVQSVIIPKDRFTKRQAQSWIAQHGFVDPGVDETEHHYRFRQMDPDRQHFKYRTIPFGRSGVQAVVRVSRLPQMRSNPGFDDFDAIIEAIRAAPTEQKAMQIAYPMAIPLAHHLGIPLSATRGSKAEMEATKSVAQAVRSGAGASVAAKVAAMPEVAQALEGTGLVPVALAQATQIAEVQTSQGVVDVPVAAAEETYAAPAVDTSQFYDERGNFNLLTAFRGLGSAEGLLSDYLHSLSDAEIKKIASKQRETRGLKGKSKDELIDKLVEAAEYQSVRGRGFLMHGVEVPSVEEVIQAIDSAIHVARTATRFEQTKDLKENVRELFRSLSVQDLKDIAAHYNVDLRRTPADQRVQKIVDSTVGYILGGRAIRGDYEEDEEQRVRERDEQMQRMVDAYREREGLPPLPTPPPPALTPSTVPSFDEFIQRRLASWHKHSKPVSFEELTESAAEGQRSVQYVIHTAAHAAQHAIEAIQVYAAVKDVRTIIDWIVATDDYRKDNLSFFKKIADKAESRAMLLLRNEYEKKYGVSPPRSNPRFGY